MDPVVRNKIVFITGPAETGNHVPETRMIKYCGGKVESEFEFVEPKSGENDIQKDAVTRDRLKDRHHRLTDQFEKITRQWCETGGKDEELNEKRQVLIKKLRLSQFELEPYTRGLTAHHRNGTLPMKAPGIATFDYIIGGKTTRQVMGKATSKKSVERELCEIADGNTTKEVEQKTKQMLQEGTWGEWRVNDNSAEMKAKAIATLEDIEGTAKSEQLNKTAASNAQNQQTSKSTLATKNSEQRPSKNVATKESQETVTDAAGAAAAGGGGEGAAASAATTHQSKLKPSNTPPLATSPPKRNLTNSDSSASASTTDKSLVIPYTSTRKARKMMKKSASGSTAYSGGMKRGFFGSLRARIAAL